MIGIRLKYVHQWVDKRNGGAKARYYFRGPGFKRILLPGLPGSPEFMDAYQTALGGQPLPRPMIGASQTKIDSIAALVVSYFSSPQFLALAPADATDLLPDPGKIPCGAWRQASGIAHTSAHQRDARPTCSNSCGGQSLAAPSQGADGVCSRGRLAERRSDSRHQARQKQVRWLPYLDRKQDCDVRGASSNRQQGSACVGATALHGSTSFRCGLPAYS
jgi:hypothetical protein